LKIQLEVEYKDTHLLCSDLKTNFPQNYGTGFAELEVVIDLKTNFPQNYGTGFAELEVVIS
jgi:hypothetical protein